MKKNANSQKKYNIMKTLYKTNLVLIFINVLSIPIVLLSIVFVGFYLSWIPFGSWVLFTILTGFIQILSYIIYLFKWNKISRTLKIPFIIYGICAAITITTFIVDISNTTSMTGTGYHTEIPYYLNIIFNAAILIFNLSQPIIIILALFLALFFIYLSKQQYHFYKTDKPLLTE